MAKARDKIIALYPGSFDPITLGHLDIIQRVSAIYDEVVILVAHSTAKNHWFSLSERCALIEKGVGELKNVRVDSCSGLTVDYARQVGAQVILRGLRAVADFEYEFAMANMNRKLGPEIETMIVFTRPDYSFVSSRMVKEVATFGGDITGLVPAYVAQALIEKVKQMGREKA